MAITHYDDVIALWQNTEGVGLHDNEDSRPCITAYLERNPGLSFVAVCDGKIIGAVLCGHDGRRGCINHLAVDTNYRNQGIGRALADACISGLGAQGIQKCNIMVFGCNDNGRGFWQNIGWNTRPDLVLMQKCTNVGESEC